MTPTSSQSTRKLQAAFLDEIEAVFGSHLDRGEHGPTILVILRAVRHIQTMERSSTRCVVRELAAKSAEMLLNTAGLSAMDKLIVQTLWILSDSDFDTREAARGVLMAYSNWTRAPSSCDGTKITWDATVTAQLPVAAEIEASVWPELPEWPQDADIVTAGYGAR